MFEIGVALLKSVTKAKLRCSKLSMEKEMYNVTE